MVMDIKYYIDEVMSVECISHKSKRYDISVKDNNNFFASDILVHNCQNIDLNEYVNHHYEVTEKLDGSSGTFYFNNGEFNVCSRNLNLAYSESNTFWKVAIKNNLEEKLKKLGLNIAIQGEVVGPGIQKNKYNLKDHELYVFNVYDINKGEYFSVEERQTFCEELGLQHVPVIDEVYLVDISIDNWLKFAEGKSALNNQTEREGLVFKRVDDCCVNFKCISNRFLLKTDD